MPLNFTLEYDDRINDIDDVTGDVGAIAVTGPMWFEPNIREGQRIPDLEYLPRPTGLATRAFPAFLDADGQLKTEQGGTVGIRLWANDPEWGIARFEYRVRAQLTDQLGRAVPWQVFSFDAPSLDVVRNLNDYMPRPGQSFARGPAIRVTGGSFNVDDDLVLQNEDGSVTTPIVPADGTVMFIDNGDGSWSVGV